MASYPVQTSLPVTYLICYKKPQKYSVRAFHAFSFASLTLDKALSLMKDSASPVLSFSPPLNVVIPIRSPDGSSSCIIIIILKGI